MRVERDQRLLLMGIGLAAVAFAVALYIPIRKQQNQAQEQVNAYKAQLGMDLAGARDLPKLKGEVNALREACSGAQRDVPPQTELASLLRALSSELDRESATDKELQTRAVMRGADYNVLPVSLRFTASFPAVYSYLRKIEAMPRLIRIDRLELTGTPGGEALTARIELSTFFTEGEASGL